MEETKQMRRELQELERERIAIENLHREEDSKRHVQKMITLGVILFILLVPYILWGLGVLPRE
jgi:hypothetical protein